MNTNTITASRTGLIEEADAKLFRENLNRQSFQFRHSLATHPLFDLPRLCELSKLLAKTGSYYFNAGNVAVDQSYDLNAMERFSLEDVMQRIEHSGAWVSLKQVDQDPEYRALLEDCMGEIERMSGRALKGSIRDMRATIIVTSPRRVTLYHMDGETNFLFQIRGDKEIRVFSQNDRELLPDEEIERFVCGDYNGAKYKEQFESRAQIINPFTPGQAVHIPTYAPHWAKNSDNISVSLSVNFRLPEDALDARVHRFNHFLRARGIKPWPPGQSALRDNAKRFVLRGMDFTHRMRQKWKRPNATS